MAKSHNRCRHLGGIWAELGRGRVEERRLVHTKGREILDGFMNGSTVIVNPMPATLDTLIHELFHRRFPKWSESYVRARTTELMRGMTDAQQLQLWKAYQAQVKRKRCHKISD